MQPTGTDVCEHLLPALPDGPALELQGSDCGRAEGCAPLPGAEEQPQSQPQPQRQQEGAATGASFAALYGQGGPWPPQLTSPELPDCQQLLQWCDEVQPAWQTSAAAAPVPSGTSQPAQQRSLGPAASEAQGPVPAQQGGPGCLSLLPRQQEPPSFGISRPEAGQGAQQQSGSTSSGSGDLQDKKKEAARAKNRLAMRKFRSGRALFRPRGCMAPQTPQPLEASTARPQGTAEREEAAGAGAPEGGGAADGGAAPEDR